MTAPPQIFDRAARRLRRNRIAGGAGSPLERGIADELAERLEAVKRPFDDALVINTGHGRMASLLRARGLTVTETDYGPRYAASRCIILCDEDRLSVPAGSFDLVVMPCGLDTVDDVPGALIAARRALRPGGLFIGCLIGAPSLPVLRGIVQTADTAQGASVARIHPQIDVRSAGDLLVRSGFSLPVADAETLQLSYPTLERLVGDIRAAGLTNVLMQRRAVAQLWLDAAQCAFDASKGSDGTVLETVTLLALTGWSAEAEQS